MIVGADPSPPQLTQTGHGGVRENVNLPGPQIDFQIERFDDRRPISNVVFEDTPQFFRVGIKVGFESRLDQTSSETPVPPGRRAMPVRSAR